MDWREQRDIFAAAALTGFLSNNVIFKTLQDNQLIELSFYYASLMKEKSKALNQEHTQSYLEGGT